MANKYIILDTETTGLEVQQGHRVIEIGAVLLNDRKKSTDHFHTYLNPSRLIDEEASKVHGITNEDLNDQPAFEEICEIEDSLSIARDKFPGQRNSLDALASRYEISGYDRTFHGALLDANILADVYMYLTGGQSKFEFAPTSNEQKEKEDKLEMKLSSEDFHLTKIIANKDELNEHDAKLKDMQERNSIEPIWRKF